MTRHATPETMSDATDRTHTRDASLPVAATLAAVPAVTLLAVSYPLVAVTTLVGLVAGLAVG